LENLKNLFSPILLFLPVCFSSNSIEEFRVPFPRSSCFS
jgi:hypothetical protein